MMFHHRNNPTFHANVDGGERDTIRRVYEIVDCTHGYFGPCR